MILYRYSFSENEINFTIQLYNTFGVISQSNIEIGITKKELLKTKDFKFIFTTNSSSNGQVIKVSGRLFPFLKYIYKFPLNPKTDIISSDELSCKNSTLNTKLISFNSNSTTNKVEYDKKTGCITFKTNKQEKMGLLGDKFFLEIINS